MGLNTSRWTPATSIRRMRSSLARRLIPCFGGIRTLRAATSTFRMSLSPTLGWMTRGHRGEPLGRVVGSLEAGTLQELLAPRLVDFFSSEGGRLGSLRYTKLLASQIKLSEVMHY